MATRACALPPDWSSKNLIWAAVGLPRRIVKAVIRPVRGTTKGLRRPPRFSWNPVVRVMARQGLEGQLGVPSSRWESRPSSTVRADAPAGTSRDSSRAATARAAGMWLWRRVIETIQHDPPVAVAAAAAAYVEPLP